MNLKKYEIIYNHKLSVRQEVLNPNDPYDIINVQGKHYYVKDYRGPFKMTVNASSKETAKAVFAVRIFYEIMGLGLIGGIEPYIVDAVRNIMSVKEVKDID